MNSQKTIDALLVDDHELILIGLKAILAKSEIEFNQIHCATTGKGALEMIKKHSYDIYIIDIELPDISGFELIENIRDYYPHSRIIVNTIHEGLAFLRQMEKYKVNAIVSKSLDTQVLEDAIKTVLSEDNEKEAETITSSTNRDIASPKHNLSKDEITVLKLIAKGMSTTDIANCLFISNNMVETHRRHIHEKLGTRNMANMIMKGIKLGLIDLDE